MIVYLLSSDEKGRITNFPCIIGSDKENDNVVLNIDNYIKAKITNKPICELILDSKNNLVQSIQQVFILTNLSKYPEDLIEEKKAIWINRRVPILSNKFCILRHLDKLYFTDSVTMRIGIRDDGLLTKKQWNLSYQKIIKNQDNNYVNNNNNENKKMISDTSSSSSSSLSSVKNNNIGKKHLLNDKKMNEEPPNKKQKLSPSVSNPIYTSNKSSTPKILSNKNLIVVKKSCMVQDVEYNDFDQKYNDEEDDSISSSDVEESDHEVEINIPSRPKDNKERDKLIFVEDKTDDRDFDDHQNKFEKEEEESNNSSMDGSEFGNEEEDINILNTQEEEEEEESITEDIIDFQKHLDLFKSKLKQSRLKSNKYKINSKNIRSTTRNRRSNR